ncbi:MAG: hypothetical protein DRP58_09015 [Spirochaetes bacterium]|nr:MAG: hypothetical protein DRP58_09015 [Spirochaetota bacterium]
MPEQVKIVTVEMYDPEIKTEEKLSDELCILKFSENKDEAAFSCLVNRYSSSIRRIIFSVFRGPIEDIEDVEQEILLALYRGLPKFSFKSNFKTYLFRLCRNKAIDFIRRRKRQLNMEENLIKHHKISNLETPETLHTRKVDKDNIMKILFELKEKERSLIIMKDVENLSIAEIAEIFHRPSGTIKSRLHRARLKAAEKMIARGIR